MRTSRFAVSGLTELLGIQLSKGPRRGRRRTARKHHQASLYKTAFGMELLEERWMLAADDVISVGRSLSAWTTADVVNNELEITYSVYNQQARAVSGAALTTMLQSGVQFVSASLAPVQNGRQLSWDLGALAPFGRADVEIVVAFPGGIPLQLDDGAAAFGMVDVTAVEDSANPIILRSDPIDPTLLASTVDANANDPFIQATAAMYDQDPVQIFEFLTQDIGYESYSGSLRGARGALWSEAGNSLDEASLGVALLRASGVPARYAEGTLSEPLAQELILSMFPEPLRILGCLDPGVLLADPGHDSQLVAETREHYWMEFDAGAGFQAADATFSHAVIGQTFASTDSTFAEAPDALRHKATVRLERELTQQGLFGAFQSTAAVLEHTFNTVELVGQTVSIGHLVNTTTLGFVLGATTTTYSPYLIVGEHGADSTQDLLIRGTDFQDILTNFPFSSQVVTGLFLEIDLASPHGATQTLERTLADRIGFVTRQTGSGGALSIDPSAGPLVDPLDVATVSIMSSEQSAAALGFISNLFQAQSDDFEAFFSAFAATPVGPERDALLPQAIARSNDAIIGAARARLAYFEAASDLSTDALEEMLLVRAYWDHPRVTIVRSDVTALENGDAALSMSIDLREDDPRVVAAPGQAAAATVGFRMARGFAENGVEGAAMQIPAGTLPGDFHVPVTTSIIFEAAEAQGIGAVVLDAANRGLLDTLAISDEAKLRISAALDAGKLVIVPASSVLMEGDETIGWFEQDLTTGGTIGVLEDGGHQAIVEYFGAEVNLAVRSQTDQFLFGVLAGAGANSIAGVAVFLWGVGVKAHIDKTNNEIGDAASNIKQSVNVFLQFLRSEITKSLIGKPPLFVAGFFVGFNANLFLASDPPVGTNLVSLPPTEEFENLTGADVAVGVIHDPVFSAPFHGALLPTVFRVGVKNLGPTTETFVFDVTNVPAGFRADTSVSQITIPPGLIAEVSLCLHPTGVIPAPGTDASLTLKVTSTSDPGITASETESFVVPEVHGIALESKPSEVTTIPGVPVDAAVTIESRGNTAETVDLTAKLPAGVTIDGLQQITLLPGESRTVALSVAPDAATPLNSSFNIEIVATFGGIEPVALIIPLHVAAPGVESISQAAASAREIGNPALGARLDDLSIALTNLVQDPDDPIYRDQALNNLDSIVSLLAADPKLTDFAGPLRAARNELEGAAAPTEVQDAVQSLGDALDDFAAVVAALTRHDITVQFNPNSRSAQPLTPQSFDVVLHNIGTQTTTYDLSVAGLPADVVSMLSQSSITLAPNEIQTITATLTQTSTTSLVPFGFTVDASFTDEATITRSGHGSVTPRSEFVSVVDVIVDPPFVDPSDSVNITARVLNSVNLQQEVNVSYRVLDADGVEVIPVSVPFPVLLTVLTSTASVPLGNLVTTGLAIGQYAIEVVVTDLLGDPIPGATRRQSLMIGSPVTARIDVGPQLVQPGTSTVTNTVEVGANVPLIDPLSLISGSAAGGASDAIRNGDYAYVATASGILVLDVAGANLFSPQIVRFVGPNTFKLQRHGDMLVAVRGGNSSRLDLYSLADPSHPALLGTTGEIPYGSASSMVVTDTHVFIVNINIIFFLGSNDLFDHNGSIVAINIEDPTAPFLDGDAIFNKGTPAGRDGVDDGVLFNENGTNNDGVKSTFGIDQSGGNQNTWDVKMATPSILLATGSSVTGGDTQAGVGLVRVIDVSDPRNMQLVRDLEIPGVVHAFGMAIDGNTAFVTATEGGFSDFTPDFPFTGRIVLATLDISDPADPQLIHTQTLDDPASGVTFPLSLGNGQFSFGANGPDGNSPTLYLVDATNPSQLAFTGIGAPSPRPTPNSTDDGLVFVTDGNSLLIYSILGTPGIPATVEVQIPKNTGVAVAPGSFNIAPSNVILGGDFDTYEFNLPLTSAAPTRTITWQSTVTNMQPGESRDVVLDTTIDFTSSGAPGQIVLPPQNVFAEQILSIAPSFQTVQPGEAAAYTLTIGNPATTEVAYDLSVAGVSSDWVDVPVQATVPAGGSVDVSLVLTSNPFALLGDYGFSVNATVDGVTGSVQALLTLAGVPALPSADPVAKGVMLELTPAQKTAGQGASAAYVVRVTNTGSQTDTFDLSTVGLPLGFNAFFEQSTVTAPPSASNFREVVLTLTPPLGIEATDYSFSVSAVSTFDAAIGDTVEGILSVLELGVDVEFIPSSGAPGTMFELMVTNTGETNDTFDLAVAGPAALVATLATTQVTLAPGQSQILQVMMDGVDFAYPGDLQLVGMARSRTDSAVMDAATADVEIASFVGFHAFFDPAEVTLPAPAKTALFLVVQNLGNMEEAYTASIIAATGSVHPELLRLDGGAAQTIPIFILPGLNDGILVVDADVFGFGASTITVGIFATETEELLAQVTAAINVLDPDAEGSISGLSYVDVNNNGQYAPPEHRILGAEVQLWHDGAMIARTYSNINGEFRFANLAPGTYTVRKIQPTLYFDGSDTPGSLGDQDAIADQFTITLPAATDATGYLFAERGLLPWYIGKSMYLASTPTSIWRNLDLRATPLWYAFNPDDVLLDVLVTATGGSAFVELFDAKMAALAAQDGSSPNTLHYQITTSEMHYLRLSGDSPHVDMSLAFTGLAGDFDGDGDVDGGDFLAWQRGFQSGPADTPSAVHGDGDGFAGDSDLAVWEENYGQPSSVATFPIAALTVDDEMDFQESDSVPNGEQTSLMQSYRWGEWNPLELRPDIPARRSFKEHVRWISWQGGTGDNDDGSIARWYGQLDLAFEQLLNQGRFR